MSALVCYKMATDIDPTQTVLNLLSANWKSTNTDNITPIFSKIFQQPKTDFDFDSNRDYILSYNPNTENEEIGIGGTATEHVNETIIIDLRSCGRYTDSNSITDDTHVRKVRTEIDRILKNNKKNPSSDFNLLSSTQSWNEFNDRLRGIFRYVKTLKLTQYCRSYT